MMSLVFVLFMIYGWSLDQEDIARNAIPVTPIDQLVPGTTAKINGTIVASYAVVIREVASGDDTEWSLTPFNLTDGSGSVYVLVGPLQGSRSHREIQPGVHDGEWWNGDAASVIGDVEPDGVGGVYLVAGYIATTPTSYYRQGEFDPPLLLFVVSAAFCGAVSATSFALDWRRRSLHEENALRYPYKVVGWPRCGYCGEFVDPRISACPVCRKPVSEKQTKIPSPPDLGQLPMLRMRSAFEFKPKVTRYLAIGLGLVAPAVILCIFLVTLVVFGLFAVQTIMGLTLLLVLGSSFFSTYVRERFLQQTVVLGPNRIESGKPLRRRTVINPLDVDRVFTIERGGRTTHEVMTRAGESVSLGEGFSPADMEAARAWLRGLATALGLRYHERLSTLEELLPIVGR